MLSDDFNDNINIGESIVVELLITQLDDAGVSDPVKETRGSPLKKNILQRWKSSEVSEAEVGETPHNVEGVGSVAEDDAGETPDVNLCCDKTDSELSVLGVKHLELLARLAVVEQELSGEKLKNLKLEEEVSSLTVSNDELTVFNGVLHDEVEDLAKKLKGKEMEHANSQRALSQRKSDLKDKKLALKNKKVELSKVKLELSNCKEGEQVKVTEIGKLKELYKEVNMLYMKSSADLKLLATRCHNLNNQNQKLVLIPKAVKSNKFVTITEADYVAYTVQLENAQVDAGNSVMTVLGSLYQMRERVCSNFAAEWKRSAEVKRMCLGVTESMLVEFCFDFNYMIQNLKHGS